MNRFSTVMLSLSLALSTSVFISHVNAEEKSPGNENTIQSIKEPIAPENRMVQENSKPEENTKGQEQSAQNAPDPNTQKLSEPQEQLTSNKDLKILEFVLANQIEAREPKIVESFSKENDRGYAFARLSSKKNTEVTFVWFRNGKEYSRFTTNVHASKKWRTHSSIKLRAGEWKVQLVSGDDVLAEKTFTVQ